MPIQPIQIFGQGQQGVLQSVLSGANTNLSRALSTGVQLARDQVNLQAGQEGAFLDERRADINLDQRRDELAQAQANTDRQFDFNVTTDARDFSEGVRRFGVLDADRDASRDLQARGVNLSEERFGLERQRAGREQTLFDEAAPFRLRGLEAETTRAEAESSSALSKATVDEQEALDTLEAALQNPSSSVPLSQAITSIKFATTPEEFKTARANMVLAGATKDQLDAVDKISDDFNREAEADGSASDLAKGQALIHSMSTSTSATGSDGKTRIVDEGAFPKGTTLSKELNAARNEPSRLKYIEGTGLQDLSATGRKARGDIWDLAQRTSVAAQNKFSTDQDPFGLHIQAGVDGAK